MIEVFWAAMFYVFYVYWAIKIVQEIRNGGTNGTENIIVVG